MLYLITVLSVILRLVLNPLNVIQDVQNSYNFNPYSSYVMLHFKYSEVHFTQVVASYNLNPQFVIHYGL